MNIKNEGPQPDAENGGGDHDTECCSVEVSEEVSQETTAAIMQAVYKIGLGKCQARVVQRLHEHLYDNPPTSKPDELRATHVNLLRLTAASKRTVKDGAQIIHKMIEEGRENAGLVAVGGVDMGAKLLM